MAETLLQTKMNMPGIRPSFVPRPHLIAKLNQGLHQGCKLTLVSAPAGFGKTTLVVEWAVAYRRGMQIAEFKTLPQLAVQNPKLCWLSLDEYDNNLTRFMSYFIAALQTIEPDMGETAVALLHSSTPVPIEAVLTSLLNDIISLVAGEDRANPLILILDDYHHITTRTVHDALTFLLENLASNCHLFLISRVDPPLALSRLRARSQLTEIRQADLRFTAVEAAAFLNDVMSLSLTAGQVEMLETRTEGWIAGLQMAALSIRGRDDRADFIAAFSGSHRFILDYLTEEVIQGLPNDLQQFLQQTSILGRLRGSLCEAVTGQEKGWATLEELEASNLFLIPLDEERVWFRYHHLFAEVISKRLHRHYREQIPELHLRAAHWFRQNNLFDEAIKHALAANDYPLAADMVESQAEELLKLGRLSTLAGWLKKVPQEIVNDRLQLSVAAAWVDLLTGKLANIEAYLTAAEQNLDSVDHPNDLRGQIAAIRFYAAALMGNLDRAMDQAQEALDQLAPDNLTARSVVAAVLGGIYGFLQEHALALTHLKEAVELGEQAGNTHGVVGALNSMGDVLRNQGNLAEAEKVYYQALHLGKGRRGQPLPISAGVYASLAELRLAQKDFVDARQFAQTGLELGERWLNAESQIVAYLALAKIEHLEGQQDAARKALEKAKRLAASHQVPPPRVAQIMACEQEIEVAPGGRSDQGLLNPLSERELEILGLFAAGLSNKEVADKLIISLGTVKAHSSNIYRKLDVRNRAQAIIRAGELNLL